MLSLQLAPLRDAPYPLTITDMVPEGCRSKIKNSNAVMLQRNALGAFGIFRRVDVEERVDRLGRPLGDGNAMPRGPDLDLPQILLDQCLAKAPAQRQRPKAHD